METAIISSTFRVVIPRKIREQYHLKPGQRVVWIPRKNSLRLVILPDIEEAYGFLEGMDTEITRDADERV